jgi:hypothetical protein
MYPTEGSQERTQESKRSAAVGGAWVAWDSCCVDVAVSSTWPAAWKDPSLSPDAMRLTSTCFGRRVMARGAEPCRARTGNTVSLHMLLHCAGQPGDLGIRSFSCSMFDTAFTGFLWSAV